MKKAKKLLIIVITLCIMVLYAPKGISAEEVNTPATPHDAWKYFGGWGTTSSFVSDGVKVVIPGASSVGDSAWQYKGQVNNDANVSSSFSIANGQTVSIEFSANLFDQSGNVVSKSRNSDALDIYLYDATNMNSELALLRIWTGSAGALNGSHAMELYGPGWSYKTNASTWILGDATLQSSFTIAFDKENLFTALVAGQEGFVRIDDSNNTILNNVKEKFANVNEIAFRFGGENGFTNDTEIILKSVNGQSLANNNGVFNDTTAPIFKDASIASSLTLGDVYQIPVTAYDFYSTVEYSVKVGDEVLPGRTFTANKAGEMVVTVVAKDASGNESEKSFTFNVVSNISAPTITKTPNLADLNVLYFETLSFDKPEFTDETGTATTVLHVYKGEELVKTLEENDNNKFSLTINSHFVSGEFTFVYEITNAGGTVQTEPQTIKINVEEVTVPSFVTPGNNVVIDYVDAGVRVRTTSNWTKSHFGVFDISYGLDVKFIVNLEASNGLTNDPGTCVDFILTNVEDTNYQIMYRVWCKFGQTDPDAPTNVFISYDGGVNFRDITDTGWISRNVDGVDGQYHMAYDPDETLMGERLAGMQRVDNAYDALVEFFNAAPSTNFDLAMQCSNHAYSGYYEFVLSEVNGQSFASTNGVVNKVEDAKLEIENLPTLVEKAAQVVFDVYAKDIFSNVNATLKLTKPDGSVVDLAVVDGKVTYTFNDLGTYKLVASVVGTNGNEVKEEIEIVCKSSIAEIELSMPEGYKTNYSIGETLTVLAATYSDNVVTKVIEMKKPDGSVVTLNVNDVFTFETSGIYVLTYKALDNAEPNPNEKVETLTINVADTTKPVVTVTLLDSANVGDKVTPTITVVDDSEYDITVTLTKPDGSASKLSASNDYEFSTDAEGKYSLKVVVEDIYGNVETVTKEITVSTVKVEEPKPSTSGCGGSLIASIFGVLALAGLTVVLRKKREE